MAAACSVLGRRGEVLRSSRKLTSPLWSVSMAQKAFTPGLAPDIISCFGFVLLLQAEVSVSMIRKPSMLRACAEFSQPLTCAV